MTSCYRYALLDPGDGEHAARHNAGVLGPGTLGIEVTVPELAARCGLGNIDPQHRPEGGAVAAIEAALDWPLPPANVCLVTIRPDADAYGSMALLELRAAKHAMTSGLLARVQLIAREDKFCRGSWPGPRTLPCQPGDVDEVGLGEQSVSALTGTLSQSRLDPVTAVSAAQDWLVSGVLPADWEARAEHAAAALVHALARGAVTVRSASAKGIALVEGAVPGALRLGYRLAPVVIAVNERGSHPARPRRIAVAQWHVGHVDLMGAISVLNQEEPGWGGSPTIIGSPQGGACRLPLEHVASVIEAFML